MTASAWILLCGAAALTLMCVAIIIRVHRDKHRHDIRFRVMK